MTRGVVPEGADHEPNSLTAAPFKRKMRIVMGKSQREKGKRGERELAGRLRDHGYNCRRGQQFCGASGDADVTGLPGIHVSYHTTYCNALNMWIVGCESAEEVQQIFYGADVPEQYQSEVLKAYLVKIAAMAGDDEKDAQTA